MKKLIILFILLLPACIVEKPTYTSWHWQQTLREPLADSVLVKRTHYRDGRYDETEYAFARNDTLYKIEIFDEGRNIRNNFNVIVEKDEELNYYWNVIHPLSPLNPANPGSPLFQID